MKWDQDQKLKSCEALANLVAEDATYELPHASIAEVESMLRSLRSTTSEAIRTKILQSINGLRFSVSFSEGGGGLSIFWTDADCSDFHEAATLSDLLSSCSYTGSDEDEDGKLAWARELRSLAAECEKRAAAIEGDIEGKRK